MTPTVPLREPCPRAADAGRGPAQPQGWCLHGEAWGPGVPLPWWGRICCTRLAASHSAAGARVLVASISRGACLCTNPLPGNARASSARAAARLAQLPPAGHAQGQGSSLAQGRCCCGGGSSAQGGFTSGRSLFAVACSCKGHSRALLAPTAGP